MDRPGGHVAFELRRLRHRCRHRAVLAVEHDQVRLLAVLRIDEVERHALDRARRPVGQDQSLGSGILGVEHPLRADDGGGLVERERHEFAAGGEKLEQIDQFGSLERLLEAIGHQRFWRGDDAFNLVALHDDFFPLGVEELDGRLRFGGEQPVLGDARLRDDLVNPEISLDRAARIEDVDQ